GQATWTTFSRRGAAPGSQPASAMTPAARQARIAWRPLVDSAPRTRPFARCHRAQQLLGVPALRDVPAFLARHAPQAQREVRAAEIDRDLVQRAGHLRAPDR